MGAQTEQLSITGPVLRWGDAVRPALLGWLVGRVAVGVGFALAHLLSGSVGLPHGRLHLDQGLMTWDGTFYRVIAQGWYSGTDVPEEAVRFFPAYPALGRLAEFVFMGNTDLALLVIANAAALGAAVVVWRLAAEGTTDRLVADRAAWMVAVVPAANVMVFAYSESLMLLMATAVLLALLRGRPGWAALGALGAGLLRPAGVLLALPALVETWQWYRTQRGTPTRTLLRRAVPWACAVVAPAVGLVVALWVVSRRTGDVFEAYLIQRRLRDGFRDPLTRMVEAGVDFAGGHLHDIYNVAFAIGFAALFVIAVRHRQRLSWLVFMAATWVVAVGGNNMDSLGRYCVVAAPFTIALAQWGHTRGRQVLIATAGILGTVWFTSEVLLGRIVP
ncbi:MAG: hypothetical protein M5U19_17385 [Microthrixaceae bacterium]|nr:hypothetical protein [Microthrixaceae bacterium]